MLANQIPGIIPVNPSGGKIARASAISPLIEAGNVYLPGDTSERADLNPRQAVAIAASSSCVMPLFLRTALILWPTTRSMSCNALRLWRMLLSSTLL